jgi:hypothetical protein
LDLFLSLSLPIPEYSSCESNDLMDFALCDNGTRENLICVRVQLTKQQTNFREGLFSHEQRN